MDKVPHQDFENHVRWDKIIIFIGAFYLATFLLAVAGGITDRLWVLGLALATSVCGGLLSAVNARLYGTKLQDRIVQIEMRLRLREVLPDDLAADIMDFTLDQLIALRFASDDELPELARKVMDENITAQKHIKMLIKDWQADWHRV